LKSLKINSFLTALDKEQAELEEADAVLDEFNKMGKKKQKTDASNGQPSR
jgi:hypothetical protein